jgi:single-strand DNA-binding protein
MLNSVSLIGRTGDAIEIRDLNSGKQVGTLSLCTEESWKEATTGEWKAHKVWHKVRIWGESTIGYIHRNIAKGALVSVQGQIRYEEYTDSQGIKHKDAVIHLDNIVNLVPKPKGRDDHAAPNFGDRAPY